MERYIQQFSEKAITLLRNLPTVEIAKAIKICRQLSNATAVFMSSATAVH